MCWETEIEFEVLLHNSTKVYNVSLDQGQASSDKHFYSCDKHGFSRGIYVANATYGSEVIRKQGGRIDGSSHYIIDSHIYTELAKVEI